MRRSVGWVPNAKEPVVIETSHQTKKTRIHPISRMQRNKTKRQRTRGNLNEQRGTVG